MTSQEAQQLRDAEYYRGVARYHEQQALNSPVNAPVVSYDLADRMGEPCVFESGGHYRSWAADNSRRAETSYQQREQSAIDALEQLRRKWDVEEKEYKAAREYEYYANSSRNAHYSHHTDLSGFIAP